MVVGVLIVIAASIGAGWLWKRERSSQHEVLFIVPRGTAVLQAQGKDDLMLPESVRLVIGEYDTLVIRNQDDFPVRIGPFKLEAGQQYRQRFRNPGRVNLVCTTMYHEEQMRIEVVESSNLVHKALSSLFR
jgi:hypothetical protein